MIDPESIDPEFEEPNEDHPEQKRKALLDNPVEFLEDKIIEFYTDNYWPIENDDEIKAYLSEKVDKFISEGCQTEFINDILRVMGTLDSSEKQIYILRLRSQLAHMSPDKRRDTFINKMGEMIVNKLYERTGKHCYGFYHLDDYLFELYRPSFDNIVKAVFHLCDETDKQLSILSESMNYKPDLLIFGSFADELKSFNHPGTTPLLWYRTCYDLLIKAKQGVRDSLSNISEKENQKNYIKNLQTYLKEFLGPFIITPIPNFNKCLKVYGIQESELLFSPLDSQNEIYRVLSTDTGSIADDFSLDQNAIQIHKDFFAFYFNDLYSKAQAFLTKDLKKTDEKSTIFTFEYSGRKTNSDKIKALYDSLVETDFIEKFDPKRFYRFFAGQDFTPDYYPLIKWRNQGDYRTLILWMSNKNDLFIKNSMKGKWVRAAMFCSTDKGQQFDPDNLRKSEKTIKSDELIGILNRTLKG